MRFRGIAGALARRGHEVHLLEPFEPGTKPETPPGVQRIPCPRLPAPAHWQIPLWAGHAIAAVERVRPRVVYVSKALPNTWPAALLARRIGARVALDIDDLEHAYERQPWIQEALRRLFESAVPSADDVTCHTEPLRRCVDALRAGKSLAVLVEQAIDAERFARTGSDTGAVRERLALGSGPVLLYAGHLGVASDLGELLGALASFARARPDARLLVVGDGDLRAGLERAAREELPAGFARFVGNVPHAEIPPYFASSDVSLNYLRDREANRMRASIKVRESLAAGRPVVTSRTPDTERFFEFVRFPETIGAASFVDAVAEEVQAPDYARARAGAQWIREHFTFDAAIEPIASIWESGA